MKNIHQLLFLRNDQMEDFQYRATNRLRQQSHQNHLIDNHEFLVNAGIFPTLFYQPIFQLNDQLPKLPNYASNACVQSLFLKVELLAFYPEANEILKKR